MSNILNDVLATLNGLTDAELRTLHGEIVTVLKSRRANGNATAAAKFAVGNRVSFLSKRSGNVMLEGHITKMNRVTAYVEVAGRTWVVGLNLLNRIIGEVKVPPPPACGHQAGSAFCTVCM